MANFVEDMRHRITHFDGVLDGRDGYQVQIVNPPVPEERLAPGEVLKAKPVTRTCLSPCRGSAHDRYEQTRFRVCGKTPGQWFHRGRASHRKIRFCLKATPSYVS